MEIYVAPFPKIHPEILVIPEMRIRGLHGGRAGGNTTEAGMRIMGTQRCGDLGAVGMGVNS